MTVMPRRKELTLQLSHPEPRWVGDPEIVVTIFEEGTPYAVAVELRRDDDGAPFVTGVAVRRHPWADGWNGERTHVAPRDIQRLPLAKCVQAALAAASAAAPVTAADWEPKPVKGRDGWSSVPDPAFGPGEVVYDVPDDWQGAPEPKWSAEARRILVPRGKPEHGKSAVFYKELADSYRAFSRAGLSPVKEIAKRKKVEENTVHQWVYRARKLGFLEPSPRSKEKGYAR